MFGLVLLLLTPKLAPGEPCNPPDGQTHGDWFCPRQDEVPICYLDCHPGYVSDDKTVISCTDGAWSSSPVCVEAIGLITGSFDSPSNTVELYGENLHQLLPDLPDDRRYHTLQVLDSHVLLCGGFSVETSCLELTPSLSWTSHSTTTSSRFKHSSVSLLGQMHLLGGNDSPSTTELLCPESSSTWVPGPDLLDPIYRACAAKIHPDVFVLTGGYNIVLRSSVIMYNVTNGAATRLQDLNIPRYDHGCVSTRNRVDGSKSVLVAGGYFGNDLSEMYSFETGLWSFTGPLTRPRRGVRLVVLGGKILATGGYEAVATASVDTFNVTAMEWSPAESMMQPRSFHAVVGLPPNRLTIDMVL